MRFSALPQACTLSAHSLCRSFLGARLCHVVTAPGLRLATANQVALASEPVGPLRPRGKPEFKHAAHGLIDRIRSRRVLGASGPAGSCASSGFAHPHPSVSPGPARSRRLHIIVGADARTRTTDEMCVDTTGHREYRSLNRSDTISTEMSCEDCHLEEWFRLGV